jgi:hypothetical protein
MSEDKTQEDKAKMEVTMVNYETSVDHNPDAKAWAKLYCKTFPDADEEVMVSWFANAMMAMYDWVAQQNRAAVSAIISDLRSDVFEILRRHDVSDQCFAEVAAVTYAALAGKEQ